MPAAAGQALIVAFDVRSSALYRTVLPTELPHQNPKMCRPGAVAAHVAGRQSALGWIWAISAFASFDQLGDAEYRFLLQLQRKTHLRHRASIPWSAHTARFDRRVGLARAPTAPTRPSIWCGCITVTRHARRPYRLPDQCAGSGAALRRRGGDPVWPPLGHRAGLQAAQTATSGLGMVWSAHWELVLTQVWGALLIAQIA